MYLCHRSSLGGQPHPGGPEKEALAFNGET
jgi:hypothetical protein